jgi:hypothetical protein
MHAVGNHLGVVLESSQKLILVLHPGNKFGDVGHGIQHPSPALIQCVHVVVWQAINGDSSRGRQG